MRRTRKENMAQEIRTYFRPKVALRIFWDGKLLPEITCKESVDCLEV